MAKCLVRFLSVHPLRHKIELICYSFVYQFSISMICPFETPAWEVPCVIRAALGAFPLECVYNATRCMKTWVWDISDGWRDKILILLCLTELCFSNPHLRENTTFLCAPEPNQTGGVFGSDRSPHCSFCTSLPLQEGLDCEERIVVEVWFCIDTIAASLGNFSWCALLFQGAKLSSLCAVCPHWLLPERFRGTLPLICCEHILSAFLGTLLAERQQWNACKYCQICSWDNCTTRNLCQRYTVLYRSWRVLQRLQI